MTFIKDKLPIHAICGRLVIDTGKKYQGADFRSNSTQIEKHEELDAVEEELDPTKLCWANIDGNDERCRIQTGLTCAELQKLLDHREDAIPRSIGRGRRSRLTAADRFLLLLCYVLRFTFHALPGEGHCALFERLLRHLADCQSGEDDDLAGPVTVTIRVGCVARLAIGQFS